MRYQRLHFGLAVATGLLVLFTAKVGASSEFLYVSDPHAGALYSVDGANYKVVSKVNVGERPIALWTVAGQIFIADEGKSSFVRVYDPISKKVVDRVEVGDLSSINGGYIWKDRWAFWGVTSPLPAIVKVDAVSRKIIGEARLPAGSRSGALDLAPNGKLYVVNSLLRKIYVIDPQTVKIVKELSTQAGYWTVNIARDGKAYFTGLDKEQDSEDWIDVWDTKSNQFIERLQKLIPQGASFHDQSEGLIAQKEMVIAQDLNRLVALVHGSPTVVRNPDDSSLIIAAIDLATKKVAWKVEQPNKQGEGIALTISPRGDLFVTLKDEIKVINVVDGKVKKTIPIGNGWGITTLSQNRSKERDE